MHKVFLGSTFKDLHEHRAAVQEAINRRDDCKAVVMEEFGARAGTPKEKCLEVLRGCQVYVGLVGHCYGFEPEGEAVSITQLEYEAACELGLPRLLFVGGDQLSVPGGIRESDEKYRKLQDLRQRIGANETVQAFGDDKGALAARVGEALTNELKKLPAKPEPPVPPTLLPRKGLCVGREHEVEELVGLVLAEEPGPVVVLGPPGIGKSTLTRAVLHDKRVDKRFGKRRWFVPLETVREPEAIWSQVGLGLGLRPGPELEAQLFAVLTDGPALLVLDNAETPWWKDRGGTEEALDRLASVPGLALVCSVRGHVAPRRPSWQGTLLVPGLEPEAAKELFLAKAGRHFKDDPRLPDIVAAMDGVPLALELLALQVRADERGLERVWRAWQAKRTALLAVRKDATHRLDSYEVSLALSLDSEPMTDAARRLYGLMGRLPAGVAEADVAALLPDGGEDAADLLCRLGLAYEAGGRYRMLAPVREHAERCAFDPADRERLLGHYLELATTLSPRCGWAGGSEAAARLTAEWANVERVIRLGLDSDSPDAALDAAAAMRDFLRFSGVGSPAVLDQARHRALSLDDQRRAAQCGFALGVIAFDRSQHEAARLQYEQVLPLYRQVGSVLGEANCIMSLGDIALERSQHEAARERYEQALPLYRQVGSVLGEANCIRSLGDIALRRSQHEEARERYEQALPLYRQVGSVLGEANCIQSLGDIALERSQHEAARERYEQALPLYRQVGDVLGEANCIKSLGDIALRRSQHEAAQARYEEARPLYQKVGDVLGEANCIQRLGDIALAEGDEAAAGLRFQEALGLYERIAEPYSIGWTHVRLGRLAAGEERRAHVAAARAAWASIDRADLVEQLEREFGAGGT